MEEKNLLEIKSFIAENEKDYVDMSVEFYSSDSVLTAVPLDHFKTAFDLIISGSNFLSGLMIYKDNTVIGYAILAFDYSIEAGGLQLWLEELFVKKEYRGHGVATKFFEFVHSEYKDKVKRLRLELVEGKEGLYNFYKRCGYKKLDYIQMYRDEK